MSNPCQNFCILINWCGFIRWFAKWEIMQSQRVSGAKMRLPKLLEPAKLIIQIPPASKHKTDKCLMCKTNKGETNK